MNQPNMNRSINQTLADYVKESAAWQNSLIHHQQQQQQQTHNQLQQQIAPLASSNHATSLPWAAAVKAAEHQHHMGLASTQSAFERPSTIGSWSSPETSSSARGGWNADGTLKGDGTPDDGTAIWGNPTIKKTGIDWAEKESLNNPTPANSSNSEKRIPKAEPIISSINGTEAWGAPPPASGASASSLASKTIANNSQQQQPKLINENSGNIYGSKTISNEPLGWGESSSSSSSGLQQGNNDSSSQPNSNSIWNHLANNGSSQQQQQQQQQKPPTDWLSSSSSASSSIAQGTSSSRIDELNKQLEGTSLFDAISSSSPPSTASSVARDSSSSNCVPSSLSVGGNSSNSINDLKQMSAKFNSNDLIDPLSRPPMNAMSQSTSNHINQQSQMNAAAAYPLGISPSRDLLKQIVHQIQLAVQAGHLNAQILNQPMSTPTLQLVYTLLQQIKLLQQFQEVQQRTVNKTNDGHLPGDLGPQISRVQQNIALLQKAITQQQAALTKNEALADANAKQQQQQQAAANNFSYANISKLYTNMKVPSNNISNIISNSNNSMDGFKRSGLMDSLTGNSNSDLQQQQRLAHGQANTTDARETIDKTLSPILQSSVNNILNNNNKSRSFANVSSANQQQQQLSEAQKSGMMSAQQQVPSSSAAAWLAFNSSDLVSSSSFSSSSDGWPTRISANVSQHDQQQLDSDLLSDYTGSRGWRTDNIAQSSSASLAPGANMNLARPNPAANNMRQMGDTNDILSKDSSPYYEWGNSNSASSGGDSFNKRNYDSAAHDSSPVSSLSPPALGGLSLQSNPWLFAQSSTSSDGFGSDKLDNGDSDKLGGDSLNYLRSNNIQQHQRSASSLYDWGNIGSMQYNAEPAPIGSKQTNSNSNNVGGGSRMPRTSAIGEGNSRPAPPPGLHFASKFL